VEEASWTKLSEHVGVLVLGMAEVYEGCAGDGMKSRRFLAWL
jgi:hypothetical protein